MRCINVHAPLMFIGARHQHPQLAKPPVARVRLAALTKFDELADIFTQQRAQLVPWLVQHIVGTGSSLVSAFDQRRQLCARLLERYASTNFRATLHGPILFYRQQYRWP